MRVAFVTAAPAVWGAERSLLVLLRGLRTRGIECVVVADVDSPLCDEVQQDGHEVRTHRFARSSLLSTGSAHVASRRMYAAHGAAILRSALDLRTKLKDVDLVVGYAVWQVPETVLAARTLRTPVLMDLHETFSSGFSHRALPVLAKSVSVVTARSRFLVDGLRIPPARLSIIPAPIDSPPQDQEPGPDEVDGLNGRVFGMFGQVAPHKRVKEVAERFLSSETLVREASLLIVGGSPYPDRQSDYEREVRSIAAESAGAVQVIDRVEDIWPWMRCCDVVINMSEHEAFGRTVVEAYLAGAIPVVADNGGPPEIVADTGIGKVCGIDSLEGALIDTLDLIETGGKQILAGRVQEIEQLYGSGSVCDRYAELVRAVGRDSNRSRGTIKSPHGR